MKTVNIQPNATVTLIMDWTSWWRKSAGIDFQAKELIDLFIVDILISIFCAHVGPQWQMAWPALLCFVHFSGNKFFPWKLDRDHQSYGSCMWVRSYYLYQWVPWESWGLFCTQSNIWEADKQGKVREHGPQCGSVWQLFSISEVKLRF